MADGAWMDIASDLIKENEMLAGIEFILGIAAEEIIKIVVQDLAKRPGLAGIRQILTGPSPEKLAVQRSLTNAYLKFYRNYPVLSESLFDETFLGKRDVIQELAKFLTPDQVVNPAKLVEIWKKEFRFPPDQDITTATTDFLEWYSQEIKASNELKPFVDSRALDQLYKIAQSEQDQTLIQKHILAIINEIKVLLSTGPVGEVEPQITPPSLFTILDPPANFTGRQAELSELEREFQNGKQIIGVTGGAGIGKTALARALARELAADYPNGLEIDLRGLSDPPLPWLEVMSRVLGKFNLPLPKREAEIKDLYCQALRQHKTLLLLDNARDAAQVHPLLPPKPSAAIITSRNNIELGEAGYHRKRLDVLEEAAARNLMRSVIHRQPVLGDSELDALAKRCGYLPQALKAAAALVNKRVDWDVKELIEKLANECKRLEILKGVGDPDLDVDASLRLSYNQLDEVTQAGFRALGVYPAPFDLIALSHVWEISAEQTQQQIDVLMDWSLVEYQQKTMEYSLHDLTRDLALSLLNDYPKEGQKSAALHAGYYLRLGSQADDLYQKGGANIPPALALFDKAWAHLPTAWRRMEGEAE